MHTIGFREWTIAYARKGAGPPVLFLHNGGTSHHIWQPVMARMQHRFDVIAVDLLGYGASSKPGHSYTMDVYVEMVRTLLDTLELDQVHIVGNCMGSAIAAHVARAHPVRVRSLVLVNPLTEATFRQGWLAGVLAARRVSPRVIGGAYRKLSSLRLPGWTGTASLAFQLGRRGRSKGVHKDPELKALHTSDGQLRSLLEVLADIDAYAELDALGFSKNMPPTLTLWGESNRVLSARAGKTLNTTLRPEQTRSIPDCGHLVMMEAPEETAALVQDFLDQHGTNASETNAETQKERSTHAMEQ